MRGFTKQLVIKTPGPGEFIIPPGVYWMFVTGLPSGAGGAGSTSTAAGCGGGGSGLSTRLIKVRPGEVWQYYVAPGGLGGLAADSGSDAQPTSFGHEVWVGGGGAAYGPRVGQTISQSLKRGCPGNQGEWGFVPLSASGQFPSFPPILNVGTDFSTSQGSYFGSNGATNGSNSGGAAGGSGIRRGGNGSSGGSATVPTDALPNSGAGGGGAGQAATPTAGGKGGSGMLIFNWMPS